MGWLTNLSNRDQDDNQSLDAWRSYIVY